MKIDVAAVFSWKTYHLRKSRTCFRECLLICMGVLLPILVGCRVLNVIVSDYSMSFFTLFQHILQSIHSNILITM